jgi:hypothetical protein
MAKSKSIGNMYATLSLNDSKFKAGLSNAGKKLGEFSKTSAKYIAAGGAVAGAAIGTILGKAVTDASSLQESVSKSNVVFGESASSVQAWAKTASSAFGQSNQQALEAAATIGNMFKAMGIADAESANMSKSIVELASDLASFNNTSIDEAIMAINAALRGESEPIRRYGVLLDEATLKADAFAKGIFNGKGTLTPATKALSAYNVILRQTTTAQGDFKRTSDGFANSTRTIQASLADASAGIGQGLLPAIERIAAALKGIDMKGFGESIGGAIGNFVASWTEMLTSWTPWELFILEAELAFAKIMELPGFKQIGQLGAMIAQEISGGSTTGQVSAETGGNVAEIERRIEEIYQRMGRDAEKRGEDLAKKRKEQEDQMKIPMEIPAAPPMPAAAEKEKQDTIIDDYMKRGLAMSSTPGTMQDKILKVQEQIRDILKGAQIQDKELTW